MFREEIQDLMDDHKFELGCAAVAGLLIFSQWGSIQQYLASSAAQREAFRSGIEATAKVEAEELARKEAQPIAEERYREQCEVVYNLNQEGTYTALSVGTPVIKGDYVEFYRNNQIPFARMPHGHVLPVGELVCDPYGNTSVLIASPEPDHNGLPVVGIIISTTNQAIVDERLALEEQAIKPIVTQ